MELLDTVELMFSDDYKERFRAEYLQLKIRHDKLKTMVEKYEDGTLDFTPKCELNTLKEQLYRMKGYMYILEVRANVEGIEL